jgi:hypothetical protein
VTIHTCTAKVSYNNDEVLLGYQPGQIVERWKNQRFVDRDGLRNVGFFTAQPFDPADSPRELHHTQSLEKQQISCNITSFVKIWPQLMTLKMIWSEKNLHNTSFVH